LDSINYNHLYSFFVVAKSGSIKAAALTLGVTPSTLSEQMKSLEKQFGERIFSRVGRSLSLNSQGRYLFDKVESFFSDSHRFFLNPPLSTTPGTIPAVEIGITTTISRVFAYEIFSPLFREKGTHVRITEGPADTLLMDFKSQNLDIFITHEKLSSSLIKRLKVHTIREPELVVVAGPKLKDTFPKFPSGLSGCPFFLFTVRTPLRWEIEKFFKNKSILPDIRAEVDDPEILKAAVADDLGLAILPDHSIRQELANKKLFPLGVLPKGDVRIYAYYLAADALDQVERVVHTLRAVETTNNPSTESHSLNYLLKP
jgi:LysR family transcriptional activator of nhaA